MESLAFVGPLLSVITTVVMAAFAIGQLKNQFASKGDVLDLERKLNTVTVEKNKEIAAMVSKAEFNASQEKTDDKLEAMSAKLDSMHKMILTMAIKQGIKVQEQ